MAELNISEIRDAIANATHIPEDKKSDVLKKLDALGDTGMTEELFDAVEELLELEAKLAKEKAESAKSELVQVEKEISEIEDEQAPVVQEKTREYYEDLDKVADENKQNISKIEADFEKGLEGELEKGSDSEADDIRKKLGIS